MNQRLSQKKMGKNSYPGGLVLAEGKKNPKPSQNTPFAKTSNQSKTKVQKKKVNKVVAPKQKKGKRECPKSTCPAKTTEPRKAFWSTLGTTGGKGNSSR